ncbi:hypothetical protein [Xenorhabdus entomophaga]|uniref:hypothetical protein n=1 Tax=Xenorhabdus entomophaga TaxID=3136257 RepID=UPI0030F3D19C
MFQATWQFRDSALQNPAALSAISELTTGKDGIKLKLHDPKAAIKQLSELMGWDSAKKVDFSSTDGTMTPNNINLSHLSFDQLLKLRAHKGKHQS